MKAQSKAIILARVSSRAQEDEGYSLDSQLKLMRSYCKSKRLVIVEEFKIAETASKEQRRRIYQEMIGYITKHRVYNVVAEKTDRLTRNFKDATMIDAWLERDGQRMLHLVKENLLLHKDARSDAKFMWNIYLSVAKKYTDNLREEVMKGWAEKLAQGWLPAEPPPGYMTVTQSGKKIHVVNPEKYKYMPRIFRLALLPDYTRRKLSEEMALVGINTKNGRPFTASQVTRILTNPFYIGINRMQGKDYPGAQEPIITKKLFYEVQRKIKAERPSRYQHHNPVFKGMIKCEHCDSLVTWQLQKGRFYGACQRKDAACKGRTLLREDRVEAHVIKKLEQIDPSKAKMLSKLKGALQQVRPQDVGMYRQKMIEELGRQIDKLRRMDENLYEDRLVGFIAKEKYEEKRKQLAKQAADAAERLAMLREAQEITEPLVQEPEHDNPIVDLYLKGSPNQKRIIMTLLFKPFMLRGEQIEVVPLN